MLLILVALYSFAIGASFAAVTICFTSDWIRERRAKRLKECTRLGRLALLAESKAIVWRSGR